MLAPDHALVVLLQVVGAVAGLLGQLLINRRRVGGFGCWMVANVALLLMNAVVGLWVMAALHGVYLALSAVGWVQWHRADGG